MAYDVDICCLWLLHVCPSAWADDNMSWVATGKKKKEKKQMESFLTVFTSSLQNGLSKVP